MKSSIILILLFCAAIATGRRIKTKKIANRGETAKEKEFPYQVSLRYENRHFCGGALISKSHVLTAAHCVEDNVNDEDVLLEDTSVEVGMVTLGSGKVYKVKRISYHPDFKGIRYQNDLAMVHLVEPVETSDKVSIIGLPEANSSLAPGTKVFVSGFGAEQVDGPQSPVLKMMDAEIVSNEDCQKEQTQRLILSNICAAKEKDYGTCEGDSGGPLVDKTKTTIVGVVSGSKAFDCRSGIPTVYTEVSRFIPYINSELNYDPENPGSAATNPAINVKN